MKYLSRISVSDDRQQQQLSEDRPQLSSAALIAKLYSITFLESPPTPWLPFKRREADVVAYSNNRVSFISKHDISTSPSHCKTNFTNRKDNRPRKRPRQQQRNKLQVQTDNQKSSSGSLSPAVSTSQTTTKASLSDCANQHTDSDLTSVDDTDLDNDDDWILIEPYSVSAVNKQTESLEASRVAIAGDLAVGQTIRNHQSKALEHMALDNNDVAIIKASWVPVRQNPRAAGVLLFKGLFTKFPKYLSFFPQFADLDIERMEENGRLLSHAVKVINTVSFVVDSIGDESKADALNEALVKLVRSHLRKKVGLTEFRNLGIVLIDFICEYNNRRGEDSAASTADEPTDDQPNQSSVQSSAKSRGATSTDSNSSIVAAWTKLYSVILDLVRREEAEGWTTA